MFKFATLAAVALIGQTEGVTIGLSAGMQQKAEMRQKIDAAIDNYLDATVDEGAEWGFLKNIVNIDKFFDSGVKA